MQLIIKVKIFKINNSSNISSNLENIYLPMCKIVKMLMLNNIVFIVYKISMESLIKNIFI